MLDIARYRKNYLIKDEKAKDNWNVNLQILPFHTRNASAYDRSCGISGITGEFFRCWSKIAIKPIHNFETDVLNPISSYLYQENKMPDNNEREAFLKVVRSILYQDGQIMVLDASFFPYLPLVDESIEESDRKKYADGQKMLAIYLYSMLGGEEMPEKLKGENNLFSTIIRDGLEKSRFPKSREPDNFFILPFIKQKFSDDINWLIKEKEDYVIVKYINYLLYFYACLSVSQTVAHLAYWKDYRVDDIIPIYYILSSEHASASRDVVLSGWDKWLSRDIQSTVFARAQALDIFNSIAGDKTIGFYHQVIEYLEGEEPFDQNKEVCECLLEELHKNKYEQMKRRKNVDMSDYYTEFDYSVGSYEEFFSKLTKLCIDFQSNEYRDRMRKKISDLFAVKLLSNRKDMQVLTLDEDILVFLIAMITKEHRTKLDNMYEMFRSYGIFFDINTRTVIENLLVKLNLLERKSDSGEAQYVRVIL